MKDCKDCEYFNGYDWSDGTPECEYDGGYESCPYNDEAPKKKTGMKIEVDSVFISDYIRHTLENTFHNTAVSIAKSEIEKIVADKYSEIVQQITEEYVKKCVQEKVDDFMKGEMTISGGWSEPPRTLTREQYISELVEKSIKSIEKNAVDTAKKAASEAVTDFSRRAKDEINKGIKQNFDDTMRKTLTDNVVNMLMANETFARMANSMNRLLK